LRIKENTKRPVTKQSVVDPQSVEDFSLHLFKIQVQQLPVYDRLGIRKKSQVPCLIDRDQLGFLRKLLEQPIAIPPGGRADFDSPNRCRRSQALISNYALPCS
jgi:hypothetical protein